MSSCCSGRCRKLKLITSLWRGGMYAFDRGDRTLAETMQRQALEMLLEVGGFDVVQARIHNNLGVISYTSGRGLDAAAHFSRALKLLGGRVDPGSRFHQIIAGNYRKSLGANLPSKALPMAAAS